MNAKKIMGAVLVALLAAALFAGVAAADDAKSVGTVFVYQQTGLDGAWTGAAGSVTFVNGVVAGEDIKEGVYTNTSGYSMYLCYPTAVITAIAENNSVKYPVIGSNLYEGTNQLSFSAVSPAGAMIDNLLITYPDGTQKRIWDILGTDAAKSSNEGGILGHPNEFYKGNVTGVLDSENMSKIFTQTGTYKLQAIFNVSGAYSQWYTTEKPLVDWIPDKYLVAQDAYTITFVNEEQEVAISASVDKVLEGKTFTVTITGMPGDKYTIALKEDLEGDLGFISAGALSKPVDGEFTMPNGGTYTVYMNYTGSEDEITIVVENEDAEVTIEILEPTLTATIGASSYFIGDKIELTLSTDGELDAEYKYNITGTNFDETPFTISNPKMVETEKKDGKLIVKLNTSEINDDGKKLDVGTYTIKIYTTSNKLVATVPVVLKQPFISIVDAPEVIVQDTKAQFIINAEAATGVHAYIFGTNYFLNKSLSLVDQKVKTQFKLELTASETNNMSAGQYFAVFQHPMYDGDFNIASNGTKIVLNETANAFKNENFVTLFNVNDRQTANAAQALCDALDSQNIDDMYVKYSFFVVGENQGYSISEIPAEVVKGDKIVISGVDTANKGKAVQVEMISTAFAAVPKETVGSAAFIVVTTEVADDGTWEITLDTSDLNVDEYSLSVVINSVEKKTATVNVVEGADEPVDPEQPEQPEQPENPEEPVAPATPGFGALAALAGLGAVAVLLLRRE